MTMKWPIALRGTNSLLVQLFPFPTGAPRCATIGHEKNFAGYEECSVGCSKSMLNAKIIVRSALELGICAKTSAVKTFQKSAVIAQY